ncbi:hypothetical protein LWI29_018286 [Acer saccharum]|uniref:Chromo domain-containing protein n=1 Tax=Acer saccharum TaxID=4024 RepID=A0AA39VEC7_ACESA|nr:hypothetical protein LWI29_018286 [Acer saccharum]
MKVRAVIKNVPVIVLFDSGSSHNFVDHALVKKLGLPMDASVVYDVMVGDGGQIKSKGGCSAVTIKFDQYDYTSDMLSLPLGGCDVVLGVQWLRTLGPVLWDFEKLSMELWLNGVKVCLSNAKPQPLQHITSQQMGRCYKSKSEFSYGALLYAFDSVVANKEAADLTDLQQQELSKLQDSFALVFAVPTTLPPKREFDHRIPLIEGSKPPSIRPYAYGGQVTPTLILPQVTEKGLIDKDEPIAIIRRKMVKRGNVVGVDVLVHWKHHLEEDATWENYYDLKARFPDLMAKFDAASPAP